MDRYGKTHKSENFAARFHSVLLILSLIAAIAVLTGCISSKNVLGLIENAPEVKKLGCTFEEVENEFGPFSMIYFDQGQACFVFEKTPVSFFFDNFDSGALTGNNSADGNYSIPSAVVLRNIKSTEICTGVSGRVKDFGITNPDLLSYIVSNNTLVNTESGDLIYQIRLPQSEFVAYLICEYGKTVSSDSEIKVTNNQFSNAGAMAVEVVEVTSSSTIDHEKIVEENSPSTDKMAEAAPTPQLETDNNSDTTQQPVASQIAQPTATPTPKPKPAATPTPKPKPTATPTPTPTPKPLVWTDWSESNPPSGAINIESKTQYRYRDKSTTTSESSSLSGWILQSGPETVYGDWGGWTFDAISESSTLEVQRRTVYRLYYKLCPKCGAHNAFEDACRDCKYVLGKTSSSTKWVDTPYSQLGAKTYSANSSKKLLDQVPKTNGSLTLQI